MAIKRSNADIAGTYLTLFRPLKVEERPWQEEFFEPDIHNPYRGYTRCMLEFRDALDIWYIQLQMTREMWWPLEINTSSTTKN